MVTEKMNDERKCDKCIYHREDNYCKRKKTQVEDKDVCLHFVAILYRHSLDGLIKRMTKLFGEKNEV